jgi:hypothetical protein
MESDRREAFANYVQKVSVRRTPYGEVDELGHTHVCSSLHFRPCSLVVARIQELRTEDAQGRLKFAVLGSSAFC